MHLLQNIKDLNDQEKVSSELAVPFYSGFKKT